MKNILIGSQIVKDFNEKGYNYVMNVIGSYIYNVKRFENIEDYTKEITELDNNNILFVDINLIQFIQLSKQ